jgi:hypothetical protein
MTEEAGIRNNASATQIGSDAIAETDAGTKAGARRLRKLEALFN